MSCLVKDSSSRKSDCLLFSSFHSLFKVSFFLVKLIHVHGRNIPKYGKKIKAPSVVLQVNCDNVVCVIPCVCIIFEFLVIAERWHIRSSIQKYTVLLNVQCHQMNFLLPGCARMSLSSLLRLTFFSWQEFLLLNTVY